MATLRLQSRFDAASLAPALNTLVSIGVSKGWRGLAVLLHQHVAQGAPKYLVDETLR